MLSFPKSVLALALASASLFAADFSKHSLTELQNLAGNVKPEDALDYKIEIHKRIDQMTVRDARAFMQGMRENTRNAQDKMTHEEWRQYKIAVCEANRKQIDSMTVKKAREIGVFKKQHLGRGECVLLGKEQLKKPPRKEPL
ncbi:MAG: DUF1104 domain-containing protein [Helicobacter sp.]|nr:DUF1104 domain-containing protein [Helicobacter sp.]